MSLPKILALDASSDACSVALLINDSVNERFQIAPRQHNALLLPMIEELLGAADLRVKQLDALAFGCGPGSFTGLRIAAGVVQGIAFAADVPVIPVSTLQSLAQGAFREQGVTHAIAAIVARINEIYWAAFKADNNGIMQPLTPETVCAPAELAWPGLSGPWHGVGSGWDAYHNVLTEKLNPYLQSWLPKRYIKARDIIKLALVTYQNGNMVDATEALPVYLREEVVKEKAHG